MIIMMPIEYLDVLTVVFSLTMFIFFIFVWKLYN